MLTLCTKLDILNTLHFVGPQYGNAKEAAYAASNALILPSHSEGMPMVVLDAWSFSLPVIMTPQCNLPEGFEAGAAIKIDPVVDSVFLGIKELIQLDIEERRSIGCRGVDLINRRFTWPPISADIKAVYQWVLGKGDKPECVILA